MQDRHLLIFDGDCGFCQWSADRLMRRDSKGLFTAVSRQRCPSPPMTPELAAQLGREIVVWTRDEKYLGGADAVFFFMQHTGWGFVARILALPPFIWIARIGYKIVAKNRLLISKWLKLPTTCPIPTSAPADR